MAVLTEVAAPFSLSELAAERRGPGAVRLLDAARWMGHALALGEDESAEYYDEAAQELAAQLLHAAALSATKTIVDVYGWDRDRDVETPAGILADLGAEDARARLDAVYRTNERPRTAFVDRKPCGVKPEQCTTARHVPHVPSPVARSSRLRICDARGDPEKGCFG